MKISALLICFAAMISSAVAQEFERRPGESYSEYTERYKRSLESNSRKNRQSLAAGDIKNIDVENVKRSHRHLVDEAKQRCYEMFESNGPSLVKACLDRDVESLVDVLAAQDSHPEITQRCLANFRNTGFSIVRACIEKDVEAEEALRVY